jgi:uncharacterized protein YjiS (DUF1127 family)
MKTLQRDRSSSGILSTDAYALEIVVRRAAWKWLRSRIAHFISKRIAARNARRAIQELEAMSERELRDIGLHCHDMQRTSRRQSLLSLTSPEFPILDNERWRAKR